MEKKLYKVEEGKILCGVCAGFSEFLKLDVNIVRIIFVVLTVCGSAGFWIYLVCSLILPWKPVNVVDAPVEKAESKKNEEEN